MGNTFYFGWEARLMRFLQTYMGNFGTNLESFFTMFGEELILIAVIGFIYWCYDKEFGKFIGINMIVAVVLNPMVKNIFYRRRPYFDVPGVKCLKPVTTNADIYNIAAQGFSFPSGHSSGSVAAYGSIALYKKKPAIISVGILLPLAVGISRVCLGVHFPTDVIAGWILGACVIFIIPYLRSKIANDYIFFFSFALIFLPGWFYCKSDDFYTAYGLMIGFIAAFSLEEKKVKFKNTKNPFRMIIRLLFGIAVFFALSILLKKPFSKDFLNSATFLAHVVRSARYAIIGFCEMAVYPLMFGITDKIIKAWQYR